MSVEVVKNVVQMVFDNSSFEKNASTTLETLEKLKEALNFEGAARGLENLGSSIKNTSMDTLYNSVGKVSENFNALEVVAVRVLQNITDKVQGLATSLLNDITLQPLKDGFSEYELQMDSVQTIMASTGQSVGTVNAYLDELNEYADRTIYSFSDMTQNIGKFTNAGVDLDKAVAAIQGVSNVAAVSGANTNEASRAMYNFAQALSAGAVKLIDWKSIENANMATVEFKEQLIQTAVAMGTLTEKNGMYISTTTDANGKVSEAFNATKMFNDSLSSQWMTTDVLVQTLEQYSTDVRTLTDDEKKLYEEQLAGLGYTEDQIKAIEELGIKAANSAKDVKTFSQLIDTLKESLGSGWTKTWQMIFGDLNEAKVLWTGINDVLSGFIDKVSDGRNAILETWHKSGYTYNKYGELVKAFYDSEGKMIEKLPEDGKIFNQYGQEVEAVVDQETGEIVPQLIEDGKMIRKEMGGRDLLLAGLTDTYKVFSSVMGEFAGSFSKNFLGIDNSSISDISITGEKLIELSSAFYDVAEGWKAAWTQKDDAGNAIGLLGQLRQSFDFLTISLRKGYTGITGILSGLGNGFNAFFRSDFFNIGTLNSIITAIASITGRIRDFGNAFDKHFGPDKDFKNLNGLVHFFNGIQQVLEAAFWTKFDFIIYSFDALGTVIEHLIEPFGTAAQLFGTIGLKLSSFSDAMTKMFYNEDVSEFETLFASIAEGLNKFIDVIRESVDFSGFSKFFNNLIEIMSSDKIKPFQIFGDVIEGLFNILKAFIGIASPVAAAFANVFGDWLFNGVDILKELASRFKEFTESLIPNAEVMSGLQHLFEGVFKVLTAVADVVGNVLLAAWDGLKEIITSFLPDGKTFADTLNDWGDKLTDVSEVIKTLVSGKDGVPKLSDIIGRITDKFIGFFGSLKDVNLLEKVSNLFKAIGDGIKRALGGTEDMTLLDTVLNGIKSFLQRLRDILSDENGELDFAKVLEAGGIGVVIKKLVDLFKDLKEGTGDFKGFLGVFSQIGDAFEELSESLGEKFKADTIKVIANAILEIAAALFIIAMIDPVALAMAVATVAGMFDLIDTLLLSLKNFNKSDAAMLGAIAGVIQTMGNAVLMMAGAIAIIGNMEIANAVQGLIAIAIMMQMMVKVVQELSKVQGSLPKVAGALIGLAIALNLLIIPIKILGGMDLISLAKGLGAVALMMAGLVGAAIALSKWGKSFKASTAFGLIMMAESIKILASAVVMVKDIPWPDMAKGLVVMAAALISMVGATAIIAKAHLGDDMMMLGSSLLMLGAAMMMLTASAKGLAGISWEDLGKLAAVLAGALVALGIAAAVINGPNLFLIGSGILMIAKAIALLTGVLMASQILGPICASIGAGLQGISESLASFAHHAAAQAFLQFIKDAILFLPQLAVALASALIEMVVALGNGAAKLIGAVVNIGKAILQGIRELVPEIAATILELLVQISEIFINFVIQESPRLFEALTIFFDQLWAFLTAQVPNFFTWLTTVFTELFTFLQTEGPLLIETIRLFIDTVLQAIIAEAPIIGETVLVIFQTILLTIQTIIPEITNTLLLLLLTLLQQLATFVPQMAQAALDIVLGFLNVVAENIGSITESAISIAIAFMDGIAAKMPEIVDSAFNLIISFIDGLATAIDNNHDALFDAIGHLISSIVDAIVDGITKVGEAAGELISGSGGVLDALDDFFGDLFDAGANLVSGFIDGLTSMPGRLWDAACSLATDAWNAITSTLDEHSPSRVTYGGGQNFVLGFINGIDDYASKASDSSAAMAYGVLSAFDEGIKNVNDFTPVIAPVFNGSKIQNGMAAYLGEIDNTITGTTSIEGTLKANAELKSQLGEIMSKPADYSSILQSIGETNSNLENYVKQMQDLRIILDSGTLVGAIVSDMDTALGYRAVMAERGVY